MRRVPALVLVSLIVWLAPSVSSANPSAGMGHEEFADAVWEVPLRAHANVSWFLQYWVMADRFVSDTSGKSTTFGFSTVQHCVRRVSAHVDRTRCHGNEHDGHLRSSDDFAFDFQDGWASVTLERPGTADRAVWRAPSSARGRVTSLGVGGVCSVGSDGSSRSTSGPGYVTGIHATILGRHLGKEHLVDAWIGDLYGMSFRGVPDPVPCL